MYELLKEVVALCAKITHESDSDLFFSYSGHIDSCSVSIHRGGWRSGEDPEYIVLLCDADEEHLTDTRDRLLKIAEELDVKI